MLEYCGLPTAAMLSQISSLLPRLSKQKRYLIETMGTNVPILQVHSKEEKLLYQDVMRRLRPDLRRAPLATEMNVEFNRVVADDWLRRAEQLASIKDKKRHRFKQPTLWFKSQSHMSVYQGIYERSQNVTSTILLWHPDKSRTTIAGSNVTTANFGAAAESMTPVSTRPPPRQLTRESRRAAETPSRSAAADPGAASPPVDGNGGSTVSVAVTVRGTHKQPGLDTSISPFDFYGEAQQALATYCLKRSRGAGGQTADGGAVDSAPGREAGMRARSGGTITHVGADSMDQGVAVAHAKKRSRRHCQVCFSATYPGNNNQAACSTRLCRTGDKATHAMPRRLDSWSNASQSSSGGLLPSPGVTLSPSPASQGTRLAPRPTLFYAPALPQQAPEPFAEGCGSAHSSRHSAVVASGL